MASFVLIHGSGQNALSWNRVRRILAERGHAVAAPDLPKQAPDWGLEDHAGEIARFVSGPGAVVVAHSFCGVLLPLVAQLRECAALVFLAAVIPEPGKSVRDQFLEDPSMFHPAWIEAGPRWFERAGQDSLAREFLFHDCEEETIPWALGTVEVMDNRRLAVEPAPFARWPAARWASIVCTEDRTLTADWGSRTTRRLLGIEPIGIRAGHCPHVSRPAEVATLLERIGAGAGA